MKALIENGLVFEGSKSINVVREDGLKIFTDIEWDFFKVLDGCKSNGCTEIHFIEDEHKFRVVKQISDLEQQYK